MIDNFAAVIGLLVSSFGLGWAMGRWVKTLRQIFDNL